MAATPKAIAARAGDVLTEIEDTLTLGFRLMDARDHRPEYVPTAYALALHSDIGLLLKAIHSNSPKVVHSAAMRLGIQAVQMAAHARAEEEYQRVEDAAKAQRIRELAKTEGAA